MSRDRGLTARLRRPLERRIREGHPWIYRDALDRVPPAGDVVTVADGRGAFVARGLADEGPIGARVFTLEDEALDDALIASRVARAAELRARVVPDDTDAFRLLHGEGDRLPGFVCDVYGSFAVLKTDGAAAEIWRERMERALEPVFAARGVKTLLARTTERAAQPEGPRATVVRGEAPPERLAVREHGMTLLVDLMRGQKTGLFLDQRESRARVRALSRELRVLNLYAYTGGFSIAAGLGGAASVETVDVAKPAIETAVETWRANGLDAQRHDAITADVPEHMARRQRERARYDLVVADPPSFAPREDRVEAALRSYQALHGASLALLAPGGYYLAASCSSHVDREAFLATVLAASGRARRPLQLLDAWGSPPDHPRIPAFPEGDYLKVLLFRAP